MFKAKYDKRKSSWYKVKLFLDETTILGALEVYKTQKMTIHSLLGGKFRDFNQNVNIKCQNDKRWRNKTKNKKSSGED